MSSFARMACFILLSAFASLEAPCPAAAQPQAAPACAAPQFHQLDFWLGDWDVRWDASPGQAAGHGSNRITHDFDNCVIHEHFDGGPTTNNLLGESWSVYHAPAQRWRQTWVDNQGGYFALSGGPAPDGRFVLISYGVQDNMPHQRMVYEDITQTSFTWRWQRTPDNGASWNDSWVIHYTRRPPH